MLDHLIFNKLKWFNVADNADNVRANGRSFYALPSKIKLTNDDVTLWTVNGGSLPYVFDSGQVFDVIGAYKNTYNENGKKRYIVSYSYSNQDYILSVSESDCTPIWGGKAPLSHLYQWFRALITRKVVIA
ncbi:hypothetical protein IMAU10142_01162 [Lactobacillus helveticus]|uniref:hypothetical protein n=1 Tax=Lactobacillus helveticus TaxID=1587 RepID=UPI001565BA4A|nr:hypothetical protein [Lactobacillus helveticus]NRO91134.1 hypothetical protein [Lactobacillus helveticus]